MSKHAPPSNYHASLAIQGQALARAAEALSKTLRGGIAAGRVKVSADEDFAQFVGAALTDLERQAGVFFLLVDAEPKGRR